MNLPSRVKAKKKLALTKENETVPEWFLFLNRSLSIMLRVLVAAKYMWHDFVLILDRMRLGNTCTAEQKNSIAPCQHELHHFEPWPFFYRVDLSEDRYRSIRPCHIEFRRETSRTTHFQNTANQWRNRQILSDNWNFLSALSGNSQKLRVDILSVSNKDHKRSVAVITRVSSK